MSRKTLSNTLLVLLISVFCFVSAKGYSQAALPLAVDTAKKYQAEIAWLKDLYEPGVSMEADSLRINKEAERLLNDEQYRQTMYPVKYTWEAATGFVQKQEIKKAVWYFINLYTINTQNKELVLKSLLVYDKFFKMDRVLRSSFYTYSFTDPEIGKIENGHSEITAPHIMEKKLNALKAILFYLNKYRPADRKEETKGN
jgi:hypothetical protein